MQRQIIWLFFCLRVGELQYSRMWVIFVGGCVYVYIYIFELLSWKDSALAVSFKVWVPCSRGVAPPPNGQNRNICLKKAPARGEGGKKWGSDT